MRASESPGEAARLLVGVTRLSAAGVLAALLVAPGLWLGHPYFGPIPIASLPEPAAALLSAAWLALIAAFIAVIVMPRSRPVVAVALALLVLRAGLDRMTWQPYLLQYAFQLGVALWAIGGTDAGRRNERSMRSIRLAIAWVYLWSGISKVDHDFLHRWSVSMFPMLDWIPTPGRPWVAGFIPVLEVALAVALVVPRARRFALYLGIAMHGIILLALGPLGHNFNRVVWPWNVLMMAFLWLLFRDSAPARTGPHRRLTLGRPEFAALLLFGLLPALGEIGLWSPSLSFRLYSARFHIGTLWISPAVRDALPTPARACYRAAPDPPHAGYLPVPWWSERELGAFVPSEPAIYRQILRRVCALATTADDVLLVLEAPPNRWTGRRERQSLLCTAPAGGPEPNQK